jgi:hypothetical protein
VSLGGIGRPTDGSLLELRGGSEALLELHKTWPDHWTDMPAFAQQQMSKGQHASKGDNDVITHAAAFAANTCCSVSSMSHTVGSVPAAGIAKSLEGTAGAAVAAAPAVLGFEASSIIEDSLPDMGRSSSSNSSSSRIVLQISGQQLAEGVARLHQQLEDVTPVELHRLEGEQAEALNSAAGDGGQHNDDGHSRLSDDSTEPLLANPQHRW